MRKVKRIFIITISIVIILICTSCVTPKAKNFINNVKVNKWVSTDPDIWFENSDELSNINTDDYSNLTTGRLIGEININNKITYVYVIIGYGSEMIFENATGYDELKIQKKLISGTGDINIKSNQIVMTIYHDNIFDNKYKTIIFKKVDTTSTK